MSRRVRLDPDGVAARDADLVRSGLADAKTIRRLGLDRVLGREETEEYLGIENAVSYEIPYFDVHGERLTFRRWKIIATGDPLGLKYYQEPKTIPHIYLPPLVPWARIAADPRQRLVITEGEKKAACACLHDLPCVGLGGVWMHKAAKFGLAMLRDFDWFAWTDRDVEVCYDSDLADNDDVRRALGDLCASLRQRGARVYIRLLPATDGKTGLDDFLVAKGKAAYLRLSCEEAGGSKELHALNERVAYVENLGSYWGIDEEKLYRGREELTRRYGATRIVGESGKPMRAVDAWVDWEHRRMVRGLTYAPGGEKVVDGSLNVWVPGPEPRRGDAEPMLEVIREIENWRWFLQWLAYPLQNLGAKLFSSVLIWSREQGTGKSFIGRVMREIYGARNSTTITSAQLASQFNGWSANKQFIFGEEVSDYAAKGDTHALKSLITEPTIQVRRMYAEPYEVPNCANFYFASNEPAPLRIEGADRRFFVATLPNPRTPQFWKKLDAWRRDGGSAALHHHLLTKIDCADFDPQGRAPSTAEKRSVVYAGMSEAEQWCADLMSDPDMVRPRGSGKLRPDQDVFSVEALYSWYSADRQHPVPRNIFGRALRGAGAIGPSEAVPLANGERRRMVAVRRLDKWKPLLGVYRAWAENFGIGNPETRIARLEAKAAPLRRRPADSDGRLGVRKVVPIGVSMRPKKEDR